MIIQNSKNFELFVNEGDLVPFQSLHHNSSLFYGLLFLQLLLPFFLHGFTKSLLLSTTGKKIYL